MAEPYLARLTQIVEDFGPQQTGERKLESRHFFGGAALYANGKIFASLSTAGFAVKLPEDARESLIEEGRGTEFRFYANGPVKREYVVLSESAVADEESIRELIALGVDHVLDIQAPETVADDIPELEDSLRAGTANVV